MIDSTHAILETVSVHWVGNPAQGENLVLSRKPVENLDVMTRDLILRFFLGSFEQPEYNRFTFSNDDFRLNPIYTFACDIFDGSSFHLNSINLARHLFECSQHPQIKSGDLLIARFSNLEVDGEKTDAIGIFKSENKQAFLKVQGSGGEFEVIHEDGIQIDRPDKGCLILNQERDSGFRVCSIDRSGRSNEARFWKEDFLQICPCRDEFHQTREFMSMARNFVTKHLQEDFEVNKADQIDLLNRSVDYFKTHETFDKLDFEQKVFQDEAVIQSFHSFRETYKETADVEVGDQFEISPLAVKKQERVFKSVIKLDKNFHIYIHGNRRLIEQGVDQDGRKFYKIYFEQET